jgi:preprotein translocase subunit SecG
MKTGPNFLAAAIVILVGILIASLVIFIAVQFWYFYTETEMTKTTIDEINQQYNELIKQFSKENTKIDEAAQGEIMKLSFVKELKSQQVWEWSHERVNRRYSTFISIAEWFVLLFVLFLAILNERVTSSGQKENFGLKRTTAVLVVFFAALAIALPAASQKLGFETRQRLHDFRAQQLGFIIVEIESGATDPKGAWLRYQGLYQQSPSSYANLPGF